VRGAELDVFGPDMRAVPAGEEGVGVLAHFSLFLLLFGGCGRVNGVVVWVMGKGKWGGWCGTVDDWRR